MAYLKLLLSFFGKRSPKIRRTITEMLAIFHYDKISASISSFCFCGLWATQTYNLANLYTKKMHLLYFSNNLAGPRNIFFKSTSDLFQV